MVGGIKLRASADILGGRGVGVELFLKTNHKTYWWCDITSVMKCHRCNLGCMKQNQTIDFCSTYVITTDILEWIIYQFDVIDILRVEERESTWLLFVEK